MFWRATVYPKPHFNGPKRAKLCISNHLNGENEPCFSFSGNWRELVYCIEPKWAASILSGLVVPGNLCSELTMPKANFIFGPTKPAYRGHPQAFYPRGFSLSYFMRAPQFVCLAQESLVCSFLTSKKLLGENPGLQVALLRPQRLGPLQ